MQRTVTQLAFPFLICVSTSSTSMPVSAQSINKCSDLFSEFSSYSISEAISLLRGYTRSEYKNINESIRENPTSERSRRYIDLLNLALDQISPIQGVVFRGVKNDMRGWVDSLAPGDDFSWSSPISASSNRQTAHAFGSIILTIHAKHVYPIDRFAIYAGAGINESEVLFRPKTRFRVICIAIPYAGKVNREVILEEID